MIIMLEFRSFGAPKEAVRERLYDSDPLLQMMARLRLSKSGKENQMKLPSRL
jgi:hypothetical protein